MSTSSKITFLSFSASESCREGVSNVCEVLLTTLPVGLDFRVSIGDRQNPVTCSAVFKRFSISKELVRELTFMPWSVTVVVTSASVEYLSLPVEDKKFDYMIYYNSSLYLDTLFYFKFDTQ